MSIHTHKKNKNGNKTNKKTTLRNNQQVKCKVPKVRTGMNKLQQVRDWYQTSSLSHTVANEPSYSNRENAFFFQMYRTTQGTRNTLMYTHRQTHRLIQINTETT